MLKEFWDYLSTPSTKKAKQDGYLYQAIALSSRAKRCQKHWQKHLQNSHSEIEKRIQLQKGSVAILGSGLMLETPIFILQKYFSQIYLLDVVHTKKIRAQFRTNSKVHLVEVDLNSTELEQKFDFVISANLLSQLPLQVCDKLLQKKVSQDQVSEQAFQIQKRHLHLVRTLAPHGLLFSDYQVNMLNLSGETVEVSLTVDPRLQIQWEAEWMWDLAPAPEVEKLRSVRLSEGIFSW